MRTRVERPKTRLRGANDRRRPVVRRKERKDRPRDARDGRRRKRRRENAMEQKMVREGDKKKW